ncbi:MAG TPA: DUF3089 domain-containing protein [Candidatus Limisoma gallistercoris]|nr:DUF3089 domain-containing protein [Candidatus Limisoma gallistercoris]
MIHKTYTRQIRKRYHIIAGLILTVTVLATACKGNDTQTGQYIPDAPDYTDPVMWYVSENDKTGNGADVLYFVSTWEADWTTEDGRICHYADVHNPKHRADMDKEISRIAGYMGENNNFYSPYYRHTTIEAWETLNEDTVRSRFRIPNDDIQNAFAEFLRRRNPQRPFILAGFSQGAKAVVEVLKAMPEELHKYLVAAYVLGYKVTPGDVSATPNIKAAQRADDTGVTICYNSVSDIRYIQPIVAEPCAMCINPVNWRTDATPATLSDTITVSVDTDRHVLIVKGYSGDEYAPIRGFLNVGDFHGAEPWLYEECLRENIRTRIAAYYSLNPQH